MQHDSESPDIQRTLAVLRRRLPLAALCVIVVTAAAFAFSHAQATKYTATASVAFSNDPVSEQIAGLPSNEAGNAQTQQASNLESLKIGDTAARTALVLGHGLTPATVSQSVGVAALGESNIVEISATASSPQLAAAIANTYAQQFVTEQKATMHHSYTSVLNLVNKELGRLTPQQRVGEDGLSLQNRAQTLWLLATLSNGHAQVAQEALPPRSPSSPKTTRNTLLGAALGVFLALALALAAERFDRRIRWSEDLEAIYGAPLLGLVPESSAVSGSTDSGRRTPPPPVLDAFSLIRARLRLAGEAGDPGTIAITSAARGDGSSTIARGLAEVAAAMGSRVLLLEANLRRPSLARELGISGAGLSEVLLGEVSMSAATTSIAVPGAAAGTDACTFDVLSAGTAAVANPAALFDRHTMDEILEQARATYDLVLVDVPPIAAVPDALSLLRRVDGVLVVARLRRSRTDAAKDLKDALVASGVKLLGVVANGAGHTVPSYVSSHAHAGVRDEQDARPGSGPLSSDDLASSAAQV